MRGCPSNLCFSADKNYPTKTTHRPSMKNVHVARGRLVSGGRWTFPCDQGVNTSRQIVSDKISKPCVSCVMLQPIISTKGTTHHASTWRQRRNRHAGNNRRQCNINWPRYRRSVARLSGHTVLLWWIRLDVIGPRQNKQSWHLSRFVGQ